MRLLISLISIFFVKQVFCAPSNLNASEPDCHELERKNLELLLEVGQLRKSNADLSIENANLKVELYELREKKNALTTKLELDFLNCSSLTTETEKLSQNLKTLTDDVQHFNTFVDKKLNDFTTKNGMNTKNTTDDEMICECKPNPETVLKFVDKQLYEKVCDAKKSNWEWTVIQRRVDGSENFYRPWAEYKQGFGTTTGEFFIGLDGLHLLTTCAPQELMIEMEDHHNQKRYALYTSFVIGDESEKYIMRELGDYFGNAGDSLSYHKSQKFTTFDQDNCPWDDGNCAENSKGAWWYNQCHDSNLNGEYGNDEYNKGVNWADWHGREYSLKKVEIKIRTKNKSILLYSNDFR